MAEYQKLQPELKLYRVISKQTVVVITYTELFAHHVLLPVNKGGPLL